MEPVKAAKLYQIARRELGPDLAELGFKRLPTGGVASWYRPQGDRWLIVAFAPHPRNDASSGGYRFTIEFRLSREPKLWADGPSDRFTYLLSADAREELRWLENATIAHLPPPGAGSFPADWRLIPEPYDPNHDIWFRQAGDADVLAIMRFIRENLATVIDRFMTAAADTLREDPAARQARIAEARKAAARAWR